MFKIGFTIGKFCPFHKGHEYLIETALKNMDIFYVVIYDTPELKIDMDTKIKWISKRFPEVKILKAYNSPKQYGLDEESVKIQMEYLSNIIKGIPVNYFYSSEKYGEYVAKYLNIQNIVVDENRKKYPINANMIRDNIEKHKDFLNDDVIQSLLNK